MYTPNIGHFRPYPCQLINLLSRKNRGLDLPPDIDIPELINFSEYSHPKDFPGKVYSYAIDTEKYFFVKRTPVDQSKGKRSATMRQKSSGKTKFNRSMGDGSWKCQDHEEEIKDENGKIIGYMGRYVFNVSPKLLMKEFSNLDMGSTSGADRWVLWVIYPKGSKCIAFLCASNKPTTIRGITGPTHEVDGSFSISQPYDGNVLDELSTEEGHGIHPAESFVNYPEFSVPAPHEFLDYDLDEPFRYWNEPSGEEMTLDILNKHRMFGDRWAITYEQWDFNDNACDVFGKQAPTGKRNTSAIGQPRKVA